MKKITKFVLIGLLVCIFAVGTMLSATPTITALTPANTYIQYNGSNAVELGKTAVRTGANTWEVTLGVTNLLEEEINSKPVEIA
ncbi:MAG TPA: hypothetical protein PK629_04030, partial [Oscillospiraceae bacterium]|nr:hypothetical protein [Oscillospiraceae bacterium]